MRGPHLQIPTCIAPRVPHLWSLVKAFVIQPSYCLLYLSSWMLTSTQEVNGSMRPYSTKPEIIWGVVYWWWPPIFKFQLVSHPGSHTCEAWWKHLWSNLATAFFIWAPGCLLQRKKATVACDHTPPNLKLFEVWFTGGGPPSSNFNLYRTQGPTLVKPGESICDPT